VKRSHVGSVFEVGAVSATDEIDATRRVPVSSNERIKMFPPFGISVHRDKLHVKALPPAGETVTRMPLSWRNRNVLNDRASELRINPTME
jgi:hypothetical protein